MPLWLVLLYLQSVFKALADNVGLSICKMSSKSQQRETRVQREHSGRAAAKGLCSAASEIQITFPMFSW